MRIFPVWSHRDRRYVSSLRAETLRNRSFAEICPEIALRRDWLGLARRHILECDMVLFVMTSRSVASVHCMRELTFAHSREKPILIWSPEVRTVPAGCTRASDVWTPRGMHAEQLVTALAGMAERSGR